MYIYINQTFFSALPFTSYLTLNLLMVFWFTSQYLCYKYQRENVNQLKEWTSLNHKTGTLYTFFKEFLSFPQGNCIMLDGSMALLSFFGNKICLKNKRMSINLTMGVLWCLCQIFFWLGLIIFLRLIPFPFLFQLGRETKKFLYETWRVVKSEVVKGSLCRASRVELPRFPVDCLIRIIFISSRAFRLAPVVLNWSQGD